MGIRYHCTQCTASFSFTRNLNQHIKETHEEKRLLCDQCEFTTNKNYALKNHIEAVHIKKYACEVCDVVFADTRGLQIHNQSKHADSPEAKLPPIKSIKWYMCDKCPYKTGWQGHLNTHMENLHGTKAGLYKVSYNLIFFGKPQKKVLFFVARPLRTLAPPPSLLSGHRNLKSLH